MSNAELVRSRREGRKLVVLMLFIGALAAAVVTGVLGREHAKAWMYARRIEAGINPQGNLDAIARLPSAAAVPMLEHYARRPHRDFRRNQALALLRILHPESRLARGMKEYSAASGKGDGYLWGFGFGSYEYEDRGRVRATTSVPKLRAWLEQFPRHSGRDDACLRLAMSLCDTEPVEALRTLHRGFREPDGDKKQLIANWFQCVLERCASAEQLLAWLGADCPDATRANVTYAAAVKRLRQRRYAEAGGLFAAWRRLPDGQVTELPWQSNQGNSPAALEQRRKSIEAQIEVCFWLQTQSELVAAAQDCESKAAALHAIARKFFHDQDVLLNHFYYRYSARNEPAVSFHDDEGRWNGQPITLEQLSPACSYRQAAEVFQEIARECPGYSQIEAVEYSVPLCWWRLYSENRQQFLGSEVRLAISQAFQAFADKHSQCTMADEALYQAGVHHYWAHGRLDASVIERNMARIVSQHPGGNIVAENATRNDFLQAAIVQRKLADFALSASQVGCN